MEEVISPENKEWVIDILRFIHHKLEIDEEDFNTMHPQGSILWEALDNCITEFERA